MNFRQSAARYSLAIAATVAAGLITLGFVRTIGASPILGFTYLVLIMGVAWWGGYGPGILTCLLMTIALPYILIPNFTYTRIDPVRTSMILLVSFLVSRVASSRNRAESDLRRNNELLERRVRERTAELVAANEALSRNQEELREKVDELARSNAELQEFAYIASHDLQEPLRTIITYSQMLMRRGAGRNAEEVGRLEDVVAAAKRMHALINAVLEYSQAGAVEQEGGETETVINDVLHDLKAAIEGSGARVVVEKVESAWVDAIGFRQVLINLISNAIKYRHPERIPEILVSLTAEGNFVCLRVADNGIGIQPEYQDKIFGLFKRLHGREVPGTGLGLAIVRRIAERQGGSVRVESIPGIGSTFIVRLASIAAPAPVFETAKL